MGLEDLRRHTYLAWFYRDLLGQIDLIRGFEGQQHGNKDAVDWELGDLYAPDSEILDAEDPQRTLVSNPSPYKNL